MFLFKQPEIVLAPMTKVCGEDSGSAPINSQLSFLGVTFLFATVVAFLLFLDVQSVVQLLQAGSLQLSHHAQNGLLLGTQLGNVTTQRSYNNFGELQEETASYQSSPLFHSYYVRDKFKAR